jgi:hypothetical protein
MHVNASTKPSLLLDALDNSFGPSETVNSHASPHQTLNPLPTSKSNNADASSSSLKKRAALNAARAAQAQMSGASSASKYPRVKINAYDHV